MDFKWYTHLPMLLMLQIIGLTLQAEGSALKLSMNLGSDIGRDVAVFPSERADVCDILIETPGNIDECTVVYNTTTTTATTKATTTAATTKPTKPTTAPNTTTTAPTKTTAKPTKPTTAPNTSSPPASQGTTTAATTKKPVIEQCDILIESPDDIDECAAVGNITTTKTTPTKPTNPTPTKPTNPTPTKPTDPTPTKPTNPTPTKPTNPTPTKPTNPTPTKPTNPTPTKPTNPTPTKPTNPTPPPKPTTSPTRPTTDPSTPPENIEELFAELNREIQKLIEESLQGFFTSVKNSCGKKNCFELFSKSEADDYWNSLGSLQRSAQTGKKTFIKYGKTSGNRDLQMILVKPYYTAHARNPKHVPNRPAIFVEAGFEGNLLPTFNAMILLMEYLASGKCTVHCKYDYYFMPLANPDGYKFNSTWTKTREPLQNTSCVGVDLLNNFADGDFSAGDSNPCSDRYRGPSAMSAKETAYQTAIKAGVKNIALSITLTRTGSKVTRPYAYTSNALASAARDDKYLEAFKNSSNSYSTGVYSAVHGKDYGHPMDYNYAKYKHSFNVAVQNGTKSGNPYDHDSSQVQDIFTKFLSGFMGMITYAKLDQRLSV